MGMKKKKLTYSQLVTKARKTSVRRHTRANLSTRRVHPKVKRVKQVPLPKLKAKANLIFSLWIRNRDGNRCVTPDVNCKGSIQASHLIKSGRFLIRWDERNVHAQCQHHNYNHDQGFHPSPEILTQYVINKYGVEVYNELVKLSKVVPPSSWIREKCMQVINKYSV